MLFSSSHARNVVLHLEALLQSRCDSSEVAVDLGWRATKDKGNNGGASHVNVLESYCETVSAGHQRGTPQI
jgi:hypothetical protein